MTNGAYHCFLVTQTFITCNGQPEHGKTFDTMTST